MTIATFIVAAFSQATQLPRSKPRSGSPLAHHSHLTPCSCNPFPGSILGTVTQPLCLVHPPVGSTGGLWVTGAKVVSWTLIAWKGNPFQGPGNQYPRKPEETEEPGETTGQGFCLPRNDKAHVSRKPWYSAQTSWVSHLPSPPKLKQADFNTQQIGHPAGCHRCRGPSWVWPQHCPLYISPVPFLRRTGRKPILQLKLLPPETPSWWPFPFRVCSSKTHSLA